MNKKTVLWIRIRNVLARSDPDPEKIIPDPDVRPNPTYSINLNLS